MEMQNAAVEVACGALLLVAAGVLCSAKELAHCPTRSTATRPPVPSSSVLKTMLLGADTRSVPAETAPADDCRKRAMRSDGRGGWYTVVEVVGRTTGVPRGGIDEYYALHILGTSYGVDLYAQDEFLDWWMRDQFVAHLHPLPVLDNAADPAHTDLTVTGLVPIEPGDTSTLDEIAEGRMAIPDIARGWPREWHELLIAAVTPLRRWRTISPTCPSWAPHCATESLAEHADLPPPPPTAKVGAQHAFVLAAGKLTRSLGEIDPSESGRLWMLVTRRDDSM